MKFLRLCLEKGRAVLPGLLCCAGAAALLLASEWLYRDRFAVQMASPFIEFAVIFGLGLLYAFSKSRLIRLSLAALWFLTTVANNLHFAVYESWLNATNMYLALEEAGEVVHAGVPMLAGLLVPLAWGLADTVLFLVLFGFARRKLPASRIADAVWVILFAVLAVRAFSTTQEYGISPKDHGGRAKNCVLVTAYFTGRTVPYKLFNLSTMAVYERAAPEKRTDPAIRNIVVIVGESLSAAHSSAFGYERDTMPMLRTNRATGHGTVMPMTSAGMMTAVSLPYFFNAIPYPNGLDQIGRGSTNLFRLAKAQGYETAWFTAQSQGCMNILGLIGRKWIDHVTFPSDFGHGRDDSMPDSRLLPQLKAVDFTKGRHFVVLHQRGSHSPYGEFLTKEEQVFGTSVFDQYDNTARMTDRLIAEVEATLRKTAGNDWLLLYFSDHGQYVTKTAANQGTRKTDSYTVPLYAVTPDTVLQARLQTAFTRSSMVFHRQVNEALIGVMGYATETVPADRGVVTGNLITGEAGALVIMPQDSQYVYDTAGLSPVINANRLSTEAKEVTRAAQ